MIELTYRAAKDPEPVISFPSERAKEARIRRKARRHGLVAEKSRKNGLWYFSDRGWLFSEEMRDR